MGWTRGRRLRIFAAPLLLASLCACANVYAPRSSFSIKTDIAELHDTFGSAASLKKYYDDLGGKPETKEGRNAFIAARLMLYNLEYLQFVSQFQLTRAQQAAIFDLTSTGVNLATPLVGSAATKSILGAVAAGLTQSRTSLDRDFFNAETTATLITAMNAQRKASLVPIVAGMNNDPTQYPLSSAIVDLEAYQQAGTIQGALQAVQADAAVKSATAQAQIDQYRSFPYQPDPNSTKIRQWVLPGFAGYDSDGNPVDKNGKVIPQMKDNRAKLDSYLVSKNLAGLPLAAFLDNGKFAEDRAEFVKDNIP